MQFTEYEMTTVLHGLAKAQIQQSLPASDRTDPEAAWAALPKFHRYQVIFNLSGFVLPVLALLPEVSVAPGRRAEFTSAQIEAAARATAQDDADADRIAAGQVEELAGVRAALTGIALTYLPLKPVESPVVPDTPEGL